MFWRVVEDAYRAVGGQPPSCTVDEYAAAIDRCGKDDLRRRILLLAARRAEAYEALSMYDREPTEKNLAIAADAMATATFSRSADEAPLETLSRLLPAFPARLGPTALLTLLASSAARERRPGETLGQALDRVCAKDEALRWAHDVVTDRCVGGG